MKRIDWEDTWINTLIDAGFSLRTAKATYVAMYAENGPDFSKDPAQEAMEMVGTIKPSADFQSFLKRRLTSDS
jgi:hypothetical protein